MQFRLNSRFKAKNIFSLFLTVAVLAVFFAGCAASSVPAAQKQFGKDSGYFIGLRKLEQNQEKEAIPYFLKTAKKGSYWCAKKSAEILTRIGTSEQKKRACDFLVKKFPDSDSKLMAAKQYVLLNEISEIISMTEKIDFSPENNELIKIRLEALGKTIDGEQGISKKGPFVSESLRWFNEMAISDFHYQFYRDILFPRENLFSQSQIHALNCRILVYRRDYKMAFEKLPLLLQYIREGSVQITPQLASDIGKTYFYGSADYVKNAGEMYALASEFKETCAEFFFLFYAGRLYDKGELYRKKSEECFEKAMKATENPSQIDNAMWYLLTSKLSYGLDSIVENLEVYAEKWNDREYFDDFFESLLSSLLICGKWDSLYTVYRKIDGKATDESVARYAYIYARLLQEGYAKVPKGVDKDQRIKNAFYQACRNGSPAYYKLMAAYHLGFGKEEVMELLKEKSGKQIEPDKNAEILLKGYAAFGFPERIFTEYDRNKISLETSMFLSKFLKDCAATDESYYSKSLRIASRAGNVNSDGLSEDDLKLMYPDNFRETVMEFSGEYGMDPEVIFALVRSESFFDPTIVSAAGAIGLTQLMEFTAGDVARKLKIPEYDLTDAKTNIQFGTFYLSELVRRCNDSLLTAFFSYNAGISRVRRWQQTSLAEFGKKMNMPGDLFLETIPFSETREYGRKLVSSSLIYGLLYDFDPSNENDHSFARAVEKLAF